MVWCRALLVGAAYLGGSIPTAYIVSRWLRGIDLRRYGSGTVSGSMVYEHVARWAVVPVGLFDIAKAALPTWLGLRCELGMPTALVAGLAAAVGHNWPVFLRFHGGRGLGSFMGILLVVYPPATMWLLGFLAVGYALGDSAPWALASLVTMPLLWRVLGGPQVMDGLALVMVAMTLLKRLEANGRTLPLAGSERPQVLLRRILLDRDISSHVDWIRRHPNDEEAGRL